MASGCSLDSRMCLCLLSMCADIWFWPSVPSAVQFEGLNALAATGSSPSGWRRRSGITDGDKAASMVCALIDNTITELKVFAATKIYIHTYIYNN